MAITFQLHNFSALSTALLYDILRLRQEVFIVEQHCFYLDADGKDQHSLHLCAFEGETLVGYARILPPGLSYPEDASVGRMLVAKSHRKTGLGDTIMRKAVTEALSRYKVAVSISAQCYAEAFYARMGFETVSGIYDDAGIPHVKMRISHCNTPPLTAI